MLRCAFPLVLVLTAAPLSAQTTFHDAHVHLNDPATWLRLMDQRGIGRAVIMRGRAIDNEGLLAAAQQVPGRLLPFVSVSPEHREYRGRWQAEDPSSIAHVVDSLLATGGFFGIGEISVTHFPSNGFPEADFNPNGPVTRALFDVAKRYDVPINLHIEVTRSREFEELLQDYPGVSVIWAHAGYVPYFLARRFLERHANLTLELSARTWRRHPRSPDYTILRNGSELWPEWLQLIEEMPDRFLVGTDASLRSEASDTGKIESVENLLRQLSPSTRAKVATQNLERLLRLEN